MQDDVNMTPESELMTVDKCLGNLRKRENNHYDHNEFKQHVMVKESLTKAFRELHTGQAKKDARQLFS